MIVLVGDAELDESNVYEALLMLKARTTQYLMDHWLKLSEFRFRGLWPAHCTDRPVVQNDGLESAYALNTGAY